MDSAVASVAETRSQEGYLDAKALSGAHTFRSRIRTGLVFGQKANSYMHLSDYMVTPARMSVPVQVEAMVEPHVQS